MSDARDFDRGRELHFWWTCVGLNCNNWDWWKWCKIYQYERCHHCFFVLKDKISLLSANFEDGCDALTSLVSWAFCGPLLPFVNTNFIQRSSRISSEDKNTNYEKKVVGLNSLFWVTPVWHRRWKKRVCFTVEKVRGKVLSIYAAALQLPTSTDRQTYIRRPLNNDKIDMKI